MLNIETNSYAVLGVMNIKPLKLSVPHVVLDIVKDN